MTVPLLDVRGLHVAFGGRDVVHGIDFALRAGEKLALVGESGSGKSVTAQSLLRLLEGAKLGGAAVFTSPGGRSVDLLQASPGDIRAIRGREIAMIFQEPMTALNPLMSVGDQIAEVLQTKEGLARGLARSAAVELLAQTGVSDSSRRARAFPHQLSGGQRQRAMIAMALACQPALLLADEPTTALDVTLRGQVLDLLDQLQRDRGMAVLMITHDLNLVRRFADRVAVMENGRIVEQGPVAEVFAAPVHPYTRKLIDSRPARDVNEELPDTAPPVLRASSLRVAYPAQAPGILGWFRRGEFLAVKDADFVVRRGRTLGVVGESGSGKSTLALAALGLLPFQGQIDILGQSWQRYAQQGRSGLQEVRRKLQVVFQDPFSALSPRMTVEDLVGEGLYVHEPRLVRASRRARVEKALADVGLTQSQFPELLERYPHEFSGGQRQRLAIARALVLEPQILVLDEPTSALDVTIQKTILQLLQRLQRERGLSYLLITHDMEVIRAMAHEVLVMKDGDIVEAGTVGQVLGAPAQPYTRKLVAASLVP
jgi:microcin C transport system ATP-binding protein